MIGSLAKRSLAVAAIAILLSGCSGTAVNISPVLPASYSEIGRSAGEACGMLLFSVFPVAVNDRLERAYFQALERANATSLTDTALTESWYFAVIGTVVCTKVEGLALRRIGGPSESRGESRGETREIPQ